MFKLDSVVFKNKNVHLPKNDKDVFQSRNRLDSKFETPTLYRQCHISIFLIMDNKHQMLQIRLFLSFDISHLNVKKMKLILTSSIRLTLTKE